jgi:hypothetical protein
VYPARFYVTYPLAFIGGLAAMYALRSEVDLGAGGQLAVGVVGAVGFGAGWSIARDHQKQSAGENRASGIGPLIAGALSIPFFFVAKAAIGSGAVLWFCALLFVCLAVGFFFGALLRHRHEVGQKESP